MTGPTDDGETERPAEPHRSADPPPPRPVVRPTGWVPAGPSAIPGRPPVTSPLPPLTTQPTGYPSAPPRPPVPTGVPPRPSPLPPPRPTTQEPPRPTQEPPRPAAQEPPSRPAPVAPPRVGPTTVVPEGRAAGRPAPPRAPLTQPARPARGRKARLAVRRIDPWSVFVTSLLLSVFLAVMTMVASVVLYAALSAAGVPDSVNTNVGDVLKQPDLLTRGRFLGIAALISAANVVLLTALATLGSLLYNVVASFTGGLELTLAERD